MPKTEQLSGQGATRKDAVNPCGVYAWSLTKCTSRAGPDETTGAIADSFAASTRPSPLNAPSSVPLLNRGEGGRGVEVERLSGGPG